MRKKIIAFLVSALIFSVIPSVPAAAQDSITIVDANNLTSSYKEKLAKAKKNRIEVTTKNYDSRVKAEEKALIDITWEELVEHSQVTVSRKSFDLMCRVVEREAGDVKYSTKEMMAECIVNRARSAGGDDSVSKALYAKGQFTVVNSSRINKGTINGETVNACKDALLKNAHPKNLLFFSAGKYFSWAKPYKSQDGSYFCTSK